MYIFKIRAFLGCCTRTAFGDTRWVSVPLAFRIRYSRVTDSFGAATTKHRDDHNNNHDDAFDPFYFFWKHQQQSFVIYTIDQFIHFYLVDFSQLFSTQNLPISVNPKLISVALWFHLPRHISNHYLSPLFVEYHHIHWSIRIVAVPFSIWK